MLDSLMALAPLFEHNPMGDVDLTAMRRPAFQTIIRKGNRAYEPDEFVTNQKIKAKMIKNNQFDELEKYLVSKFNSDPIKPEDSIKMFLQDPSAFITNITEVERMLQSSPRTQDLIEGVYGRFTLPCRVKFGDKSAPAILLITDSKKETDIGVAYGFPTEELNSNEMYVSDSITDQLQPTDEHLSVYLDAEMASSGFDMLQGMQGKEESKIDFRKIIESVMGLYLEYNDPNVLESNGKYFQIYNLGLIKEYITENKETIIDDIMKIINEGEGNNELNQGLNEETLEGIKFEHKYKIKKIITHAYNKWPLYYGNVVMIDYRSIQSILKKRVLRVSDRLHKMPQLSLLGLDFSSYYEKIFAAIDGIKDFGLEANILYKDRYKLYYDQDMTTMKIRMEKIGIQLSQNYTLSSPRLENMEKLQIFTDMQNSSFLCVILLLAFVSGIVVYSLMLFDIDERRYEMGMLRTLGMSKQSIIVIVFNQAF
jgi:ABC-type antimicrobial peptide transport system permease subunit